MNNSILFGIAGLVLGLLIAFAVMFFSAPKLMLIEDESKYDFNTTVLKFEESVTDMGWKIPAVHDLQNTMDKFGKKVRPVKVFELCHPDHAFQILRESDERIVSSLMPCRVSIYEKEDGKVYISRMNSGLVSKTMGKLISGVMSGAAAENELMINSVIK